MRRGLMAWDPEELPRSTLDERLARLRAQMKAAGLDAFVAYTNIARGAAVCWLTGFTPYWNEGLLYVPAEGEPLFATALSKRVAEWIGSVMPLGEVVTTPKPPSLIGEKIKASGARRIGVLELDDFPAGHAATILATAPGVELIDATAAFGAARSVIDEPEKRLMARAAALAETGLAAIDPGSAGAGESDGSALAAPCDAAARLGGAEECFTTMACDLARSSGFLRTDTAGAVGATFAVRVALAYKGVWARRIRSFARDPQVRQAFDAADARLAAFAIPADGALDSALEAHFKDVGVVANWVAEQPCGSYPLAPVAVSAGDRDGCRLAPEAPCVLTVELSVGGRRWIGARLFGA